MFKVTFNSPLNLLLLKILFFQIITLLQTFYFFVYNLVNLILHILPLPFGMSA